MWIHLVGLASRMLAIFLEMAISLATRSKRWLSSIPFWIPYTMLKVSLASDKKIMDTTIV
jgi:hypothetical protein